MKKLFPISILAISFQLLSFSNLSAQTGTWTKVTTNAPHENQGGMVLLTDGTVLCHNSNGGSYGTGWDRLTPNASGSYVNGTWTSIASMGYGRLFFPTQVLPSGKVFAAGGEYGSGATRGEVYDPVANTWTATGAVVSNQNIYDGNSEILPNGTVLVGVQNGLHPSFDNLFYTPSTNAWTTAPINVSPYNHDEAAWLKLPDSSILFVGIASTASVRYRPQTNTWVDDGTVPVNLYDVYGEEAGPAFMLPNGKAVFFGARGQNALYTPTGNATAGTWATAASFPAIRGTQVGQADAPGCMMVNGHILLACSPIGTSANNEFLAPIYFVEYDYTTNTCTQVHSVLPGLGGDSVAGESCYQGTMLELPDGTVLFDVNQAGSLSSEYFIYTPGSAAIAQGKPTINSILPDGCPDYKLTGKLFNGISEGAAYGDDWQMASNYPIIRLTNGTNVYYAKTTNWNRIGAVQTDSLEDTVIFALPTIPSGTYSLVVVANGFASNPTLFTVLGISSVSETNITCATPEGTASVTASGGLLPLTYTWTPGGYSTSNVSGINAGTYTITVTDNNGCTATASVIITQSENFTLTASTTANVSCNGGSNGSVSSTTGAGGTTPYTYSWSSGGGTNTTASGLSAGTYTLTVRDNCGSTETASTIITQPASSFSITVASHTNISCLGGTGTATANAATGGASPYTYSWSAGGGTNLTTTGLSAGTYTITATQSGGCGMTTATVTITQPASNVGINISSQANISCNGGNNGSAIASAATGGTSPYTYSWSGGGGTNLSATNLAAGGYTITVTDNHGCTASASVSLTQPATSVGISIATTSTIACNGGSGSATANSATAGTSPYIYSWSGGEGSNLSATNLSAGVYTITATDNNGCIATASASITQPGVLGISIASETNVNCNSSGSAIANAATGGTAPYTYSWSGGGGSNLTASNLSAGTYTIGVTDANECTANASITITQSSSTIAISISAIGNVSCNGGNSGSITADAATGGTSPYTYSWSSGGGTNLTTASLGAGTYSITATDNNGCSATASAIITQPSSMFISAFTIDNVNCNGNNSGSASASQTGGTSPYTYLWSDAGSQSTAIATGLVAGTYTVQVIDSCGSSATAATSITEPNLLGISASTTGNVTCNGNNSGTASASQTGGTSPYSYLWNDAGSQTTATANGLIAGTYTVIVTDSCGNSISASVIITQPSALAISTTVNSNVNCNGGANGLASSSQSGGTPPYTYFWSNSSTGTNSTGLSAGTYTLQVSDSCGATATASVTITQPASLNVATDSINATTGNCNGSAWAIVNGGSAPYSYSWTGGLTTDTISNLCAANYCCTITDGNGCSFSICVTISSVTGIESTLSNTGEITVYPNPNSGIFTIALSSNGGVNSYVEVYNILGEKVYDTNLYSSASGKSDNIINLSDQPNGVYLFRIIKENGGLIGSGKIVIQR